MSKPSQREQVQKGLQHLKGSDKIIGDIVGYCVQAYKADPSQKTIDKVKKYVEDTANSVSEHVLTIAHNLNKIIDAEAKEIEALSFQTGYVSHRLKSHQRYMSELFMTKFQTFPRPRPTIHILRQAIPENQLPRYARRKRPWQRQKIFDYKILDQVGAKQTSSNAAEAASPRYGPSGINSPSASASMQSQPKSMKPQAAIKPFNPYEAASSPPSNSNPNNQPSMSSQNSMSMNKAPAKPTTTLFQQSQNQAFGYNTSFNAAPPSFSSVDPNVGRGMSPSVVKYVGDDEKANANKPPPVNNAPAVPAAAGGPPPDIPPMANAGGPPQPPQPPQPPPVPNFGAAFKPQPAAADAGGPPPVPPVPSGAGGPPVPPVPNGAGGPPPVPPVPNVGAPPSPPQPPPPP